MQAFPIIDVSGWPVIRVEPQGRSGKQWLREDGTPLSSSTLERDWLFKPVVVHSTGHRQGGDWAEKVVAELAAGLGLPTAEVELARWRDFNGTVSRNVAPDGWDLVDGFVLMSAVHPVYEGGARIPGRPGHSLESIRRALDGVGAPPGTSELDGWGVFAGFLLLDAWVGNQDRHDRNWAVLERSGHGERRLAPSFDHTSSLGFNRTDEFRRRCIEDEGGVRRFAEKGRAVEFEHEPSRRSSALTLVELAGRALTGAGTGARDCWMSALERMDEERIASIVTRVPTMSVEAASFVVELLVVNRGRLLDVA